MNALELLLERQSDSKLTTPGPTSEQLEIIKQAALRAPDHAALKPWQFILVEGEAREKLGEIYYQAALKNNADEKTLERAKELPLRAPLIIICIAKYKPHAKVPRIEQVQSAGCAVMAMQQAAFAQGLAGVWRTGSYAQDALLPILSSRSEVSLVSLATSTGLNAKHIGEKYNFNKKVFTNLVPSGIIYFNEVSLYVVKIF